MSTTTQNLQIVRDFYAAYGRADLETLLSSVAENVDWQMMGPSEVPYAGPRRGRSQVAEFFRIAGESLVVEGFEPQQFLADGDKVVTLGHERLRVKRTGRVFENDWVMVYTLVDERIVRFREYGDAAAMLAAFR